ncbi:MAG: hypothetical protein IT170_12965 [Bryobacterales bacterium]|nr:hypothetical protein [Bryobacterales bacterium]
MARIQGIPVAQAEDRVRKDLEAQEKRWGAPLFPYPIYARNPALYVAVRGMWKALGSSGKVDAALLALSNRRVASHNGCVF